jgi:2,3-bisphosphoglycerate-independent phosphoglycerate mutase
MDGRDTAPESGAGYIEALLREIRRIGVGRIATVVGRYYAMDRDKRWDRLEIAWKMLTRGEGKLVDDLAAGVEASYRGEGSPDGKPVTDEFVMPLLAKGADGKAAAVIKDGDACFFYNFRADRARQLTLALSAADAEFPHFDRAPRPKLSALATMTVYDAKVPVPAAYQPQSFDMILSEVLSKSGLTQLRTAETEKYAHVTYFFNGGREAPWPGEDRALVPSPKVSTYDLQPEMSAGGVTDTLVAAIGSGEYDFIVANYANPDMVGHTGVWDATIRALTTIDGCLARVVDAVEAVDRGDPAASGAVLLVSADHGNADEIRDAGGAPVTAHSLNPVPIVAVGRAVAGRRLRDGVLADVTPTVLELAGLPTWPSVTGRSLLEPVLPSDGPSSPRSARP